MNFSGGKVYTDYSIPCTITHLLNSIILLSREEIKSYQTIFCL